MVHLHPIQLHWKYDVDAAFRSHERIPNCGNGPPDDFALRHRWRFPAVRDALARLIAALTRSRAAFTAAACRPCTSRPGRRADRDCSHGASDNGCARGRTAAGIAVAPADSGIASAAASGEVPGAYIVFIYSMIARRSASGRSVPYSWPPFPLPLAFARSATKRAFLDGECSVS